MRYVFYLLLGCVAYILLNPLVIVEVIVFGVNSLITDVNFFKKYDPICHQVFIKIINTP